MFDPDTFAEEIQPRLATSASFGSAHEHETLGHMASVTESCRRRRMPLAGVTAVGEDRDALVDAVAMLSH